MNPLILPAWAVARAKEQEIDLDQFARNLGFDGYKTYDGVSLKPLTFAERKVDL